MSFTVEYIVGKHIERNVFLSRITPAIFACHQTRKNHRIPHHHDDTPPSNSTSFVNTTNPTTNKRLIKQATEFKLILNMTFPFISPSPPPPRDNNRHLSRPPPPPSHPLYQYLKNNYNPSDKGWICLIIHQITASPSSSKKSRSEHEKQILLVCFSMFCGFAPTSGPLVGWKKFLCNAFGYAKPQNISTIASNWVNNGCKLERKVRSDKGQSVFNSHIKRKHTFTPLNI